MWQCPSSVVFRHYLQLKKATRVSVCCVEDCLAGYSSQFNPFNCLSVDTQNNSLLLVLMQLQSVDVDLVKKGTKQ